MLRNRAAGLMENTITKNILAIVMGFIGGAIALGFSGFNPGSAYAMMFQSVFTSPSNMMQVLVKAMPSILTGLSVAFAFKTGLFNIGGEGQYLMGAIAAVLVAGKLNMPPVISVIVIMIVAIAAGGLYGALSGYLKARFGIHEVITTIMLNWIAFYFNNYIIQLPGIGIKNTEYSIQIHKSAWTNVLYGWANSSAGSKYLNGHPILSSILLGTDVNYGILIAIAMAFVIWFVLRKTTLGFQLRAVGSNKQAAKFAGIHIEKNIVLSMFFAGGLAGLAGGLQMAGTLPHSLMTLSALPGYGFNGLTVALMAGSSPIGCIFTALFLAILQFGGSTIQMNMGAPSEVINIMIGIIVFFVAISTVFSIIARKIKGRSASHAG